LVWRITVDIGKRNRAGLASKVLEILPTRVPRQTRNYNAEACGPAGADRCWALLVVVPTAVLLSKLYDDVLAQEGFSVEVVYDFLSVPAVLKLDETEARHNTAVNDFTIAIEKLLDVFRAGVTRQATKIQAFRHFLE